MAGERVLLVGDTGGRIRSFVSALDRFPASPAWVVVGGFAVNVRIAQVHRLTNDLDTISAQQSELIEILLAQPGADQLDHAKLRFTGEMPAVDIDVMDDTSSHSLPREPGDRAFALARRYAMQTREQLAIVVTEGAEESIETTAPVARSLRSWPSNRCRCPAASRATTRKRSRRTRTTSCGSWRAEISTRSRNC